MLTLNDGRSELWQWDTGRKLTVDADCTQVHFSNKFFGRSVDVDVFDGTAEIPDVLLQVDKELLVWAFVGTAENGYTKISKVFKVNKRNKPADYVFTPTEQTTLDEIMKRLDRIEEGQDPDAIKNAVDEYLANNPIEIDETDPTVPEWAKQPNKPRYTASEVGALSADTVIPTIPDNVSAFRNDAGYLTEHQDLTGYATEKYVQGYAQPKGDYLTEVPDAYATKEFVTNKIAEAELGGEEVDLSGYALKSELPTKTSQLENDSGYLNAVPEGYAKTEDIPTKPEDIGAQPAGDYAIDYEIRLELEAINRRLTAFFDSDDQTLDELSEIVAYITSNKSLIDAITTSKVSVADIVNNLTTNVTNKPLSAAQGVALKALIDAITIPTKISQLTNDKGYITSYTETDPTVPSWAKQPNKPRYTSSEVGALPSTTKIPSKTSDLTNDSGFITGYTETDPTVPAWAKNATKPSYSKSEVGLGNVDNVKQYSASNPPPYPVTSVNGKTGAVTITVPTVPTKVSAFENDKGYLTQHQDISGLASKFDPTVYGLPVLELTGDTTPIAVSKDNKVTLTYVYGDRSGTCTLKGQGATSYKKAQELVNAGKAGKFNYTINFDTAFEANSGWGAQKKYCLKANWIDHSHSRNVVSAKLWGAIVKSRTTRNTNLYNLVNGGAVDGFPVVIMLNGEFHGLYTFNIPKDGWMFGLVEDAMKTQAMVGANDHELATQFKGELAGDESDFELEFVSDEDNADWVTTSLNRLINACINSWGGDLDTEVAKYLDWDSAIDYYIWVVVCKGTDMVDKNYLLTTFDGTKWHFTAYDMDSTYGLNWDGSGLTRAVSNCNFEECASTHRVYELIKRFKTNALKARYNELRQNVLSETRICNYFENFAWAIPSPVVLEDVKRYPTVMGSSVNGIDQIARWVRQRLEQADKWVNALPAQETPVEPEKPVEMVNQVPISTDTDGTIYNGTGYKDNARLSSSGGVSSTAQAGSVVTGFIPFTPGSTIRLKGADFLDNYNKYGGHYYINFYDTNKIFKVCVGEGDVAKNIGGCFDARSDEATGIITIKVLKGVETEYGVKIDASSYFRINAYGKGSDLIITVNQEITT